MSGADLMLHVGGQVNLTVAFKEAVSWIERHLSMSEELSPHQMTELEAICKERLREVYRRQWNMPSTREVLASGSHLMMWSHLDICKGYSRSPRAHPIALKLATEVQTNLLLFTF